MPIAMHKVPLVTICAFLLLSQVAVAKVHDCIHDIMRQMPGFGSSAEVSHPTYPFNTSATHSRRAFGAQQSSYEPIRIQLFFDQGDCASGTCGHCESVGQSVPTYENGATTTCADADVLTTAKRTYVMDTLMPAAAAFLNRALNVVRVSGNLVVDGSSTCGSSPGTVIPSEHSTTGVSNADFIVYVTAAPKVDRSSATVAWAAACRRDSAGRPLVAHVNFIPAKLENAGVGNTVDLHQDTSTAVHEIMHALGFSSPFFSDRGYLDVDGQTMVQGGTTTETSSSLGKSVTYLTSPRVVAEARRFFDCTTLVGGEIEDQGGSGTAGSHWEKRIYSQDSMSGISTNTFSYHSRLTLAFFEDTGHYTANYDAAEDSSLLWGRSKGCSFAQDKCSTVTSAQTTSTEMGEFCFDADSANNYCTLDHMSIGYCAVGAYASLDAGYQYFASNPTYGGSVYHSDYCPMVLPYGNRICVDPTNSDSQDIYGNTFSASSRCFMSNLLQRGFSVGSGTSARCFVPSCNGVQLLLSVQGTQITCPTGGTAGDADISALGGAYTGTVHCPVSSTFGCGSSGATTTTTAASGPSPGTPATTATPAGGGSTPSGATTTTPSPGAPSPPTTAATTPTPTTFSLVPTAAPADLPLSCDARLQCAQQAMTFMPLCRSVARAIQDCFGRDCDPRMEAFMTASGVTPNCGSLEQRTAYGANCVEGASGVSDLCVLATSSAPHLLVGRVISVMIVVLFVLF